VYGLDLSNYVHLFIKLFHPSAPNIWFFSQVVIFNIIQRSCMMVTNWSSCWQARDQGGGAPLEKYSPPLEKCFGHIFKLLDIVYKICPPVRKLLTPLVSKAGYGPGYWCVILVYASQQYCLCVATKTFRVLRGVSGFIYFLVILLSPPSMLKMCASQTRKKWIFVTCKMPTDKSCLKFNENKWSSA